LLRFRLIAASVLLATVGCSADSSQWIGTTDGGSQDAAATDGAAYSVAGIHLLDSLATSGISLVPGEVVGVRLGLTGYWSEPVDGARLEIALIGQSMNSTASLLVGYSDADGIVSFYLQAGSVPTSFELRVTVGFLELYVPIEVTDVASQTVQVSVSSSYPEPIESATISAYANRTCAELVPDEPSSATVTYAGGSTTFQGSVELFEGATYAIEVKAETTDGTNVHGCVDAVTTGGQPPVVNVAP